MIKQNCLPGKEPITASLVQGAAGQNARGTTLFKMLDVLPEELPIEAAQNLMRRAGRMGRRVENIVASQSVSTGDGLERILAERGYSSTDEESADYFDQTGPADERLDYVQGALVGWG